MGSVRVGSGENIMIMGGSCPKCGYVIRKWAMRCPQCRTDLDPPSEGDEAAALAAIARRHLRKYEGEKNE